MRGAKANRSGLSASKRAWLAHLRACARTGEPLRGYAKRKGLSEHSLYQAAKELRALGAWGPRAAKPRRPSPSAFVQLETPLQGSAESAWRIRLPNGVSLEGGAPLGEGALRTLIEALAPL